MHRHKYMGEIWLLRGLIFLGMTALGYYYYWWLEAGWERFIVFLPMALWALTQFVPVWVIYLASIGHTRPLPENARWPSVDVFLTAFHEPYALIAQSLRAASVMRGPHKTWLLDDGDDPELAHLAASLGVRYLTRADHHDAKAGNINAAMARTNGEIVVIFDADHVPTPDFLERTVGYFQDPGIGFVQVMLTFRNGSESWVAQAAEESSRDVYNPIATGADGLGCATLIGSNALIRRAALTSCGGYHPGLAEDLATSVALHAAGWQSVYVAAPLAPGLSPVDLGSWFTQQMKWARGVFEVFLTAFPGRLARLTWGQRLSYILRMTYYLVGPVAGFHLMFTMGALFMPTVVSAMTLQRYVLHLMPLAVATITIRHVALRVNRHPTVAKTLFLQAMTLVHATWPVYSVSWIMSLLRRPLAFHLTPKTPVGSDTARIWVIAQSLSALALIIGLGRFILSSAAAQYPLVIVFTLAQIAPSALLFWNVRHQPLPSASASEHSETETQRVFSAASYD